LSVEWNTADVNFGVYRISANATTVEGDTKPDNNNFVDGNVAVISASAQTVPYWLLLILFLGLGVIAGLAFLILLLATYYMRRRRKARKEPRYVVLVHPHI